ncbi:hypothetical protein LPB140_01585 [Sphingorhabdus lutea]|uniref:Outer membrane protein assembly factor BamE domain-containing protein n=2 Tax=Sphingorhabdus lutea TaxID=1913578 RepID=A0A1L3JEA7_9SPHN|nr:hypothetical protein LPB140_01585 [Sphingorhabdus lutea]
MGRVGKTMIALSIALAISGCTRLRVGRGYIVDENLVSSVQAGVDNKESVEATLGRPSFVSQFDSNQWYYYARVTRQLAFSSPKGESQTLLRVQFDNAGNVASVSRSGLELAANIKPEGDKTDTKGSDRGFFEDLFGNIGTVGTGGAPQ